MRKLKLSVMFALALGGCTSLQVVTLGPGTLYAQAPFQSPINPVPEVAVRKDVPEWEPMAPIIIKEQHTDIHVCPAFTFRKTSVTPPLVISDTDDAKQALMKHVEKLRAHINLLNEQKASDERKYTAACKRFNNQDK